MARSHRARRTCDLWHRPGAAVALLLSIGLIAIVGPRVAGQVLVEAVAIDGAVGAVTTETPSLQNRPFLLPIQPTEVLEALEDYTRYRDLKEWERAFKSLEQVRQADRAKLLADKSGFLLPIETRLRRAQCELPTEGREAFRLFYEAEAKRLLAEATGRKELERLTEVSTAYFATSVGDVATDRLGDIYFERGSLDQAADCWEAVLQHHPDSALPRLRLLTKAAISRARAGRWRHFDELAREIREKHAGESITLGGRKVVAAEHVAALAAQPGAGVTVGDPVAPPDLTLPKSSEPLWKFEFFSPEDRQRLDQMGQNWGWGRLPVVTSVPPIAFDERRCFFSLLGIHMAVDCETGKLLWRSGKLDQPMSKIQNNPYNYMQSGAIAVADGRVFTVAFDTTNNNNDGRLRLRCLDVAGGKLEKDRNDKVLWDSTAINELKPWAFAGHPLVVGDRLYVCGKKQDKEQDLHVVCLNAKDGRLLWTSRVGARQTEEQRYGNTRHAQPRIILYGGKLYVETHLGAVAELDAGSGKLNWGYFYDTTEPNQNYWYGDMGRMITEGPPVVARGAMFFKGMRATRLVAIDLATANLLWQRPVSESALLIGVDGERILCTGEELTSIDAKSRKLQWATPLPTGSAWIKPVITRNRIYQFTPRGIFEFDKATGDRLAVFRGADLESLGGEIFVTPHALITVSNLAITAYPLKQASP